MTTGANGDAAGRRCRPPGRYHSPFVRTSSSMTRYDVFFALTLIFVAVRDAPSPVNCTVTFDPAAVAKPAACCSTPEMSVWSV